MLVLFDAPEHVDEDHRRNATQLDFWHWRESEGGVLQFLKSIIPIRTQLHGFSAPWPMHSLIRNPD